ncbi:MAG TPA: ATP-dependent dethiobiotin synthetase BioD [Desulfobulbaceae bacterium]|nr:ATP-dependent dethiobiotin synthetase BioD [Desulfobulbaceae bacterium]HHD64675.1 ATP-dependent dethiobiotin synthetase BioD [Desulfobulbaceae bacterium]
MKNISIAVCGIDTEVGKSVVTGLLAEFLRARGDSAITQKPVQTGCSGKPEDILLHRRLMATSWNDYDERGLTCSYCLPFPGSPHLAAELAGRQIEPSEINRASEALAADHDYLLIEGAGGLLVPLREDLLQLDYFHQCGYPIILVTMPRLGSINHTLLSLEAIKKRGVRLLGLVYNLYGDNPLEIVRDSRQVMERAVRTYGFSCPILLLPDYTESRSLNWQPVLDGLG